MNRVLGISFGTERIYCSLVNRENGKYFLEDATSFIPANVVEDKSASHIQRIVRSLRAVLDESGRPCKHVAVSFPSTWMLVHTFPAPSASTESQLQERVAWELRQHFPGSDVDSFAAMIYPLMNVKKLGSTDYLCVSIEKKLLQHVRDMFQTLDVELVGAEISPIAAHETYDVNYPELGSEPTAIIEYSQDAVVFTAVQGDEIIEHEELSAGNILDPWRDALRRAEARANKKITHLLLHGESLTKPAMEKLQQHFHGDVRRFNAFRKLNPLGLTPRAREYCKRTAHLYIASTGVAFRAIKTN